MFKIEVLRKRIKSLKRLLLPSLLIFLSNSFLLLSTGSISSIKIKDPTDAVVVEIKNNNKKHDYSLWSVKSSPERNDWLGGDIKPWLYSLSNSWSVFNDDKHNHNFLITFSDQNQTFIKNTDDSLISVTVIASPAPSSLSFLNFKVNDGQEQFDGKKSFYMSRSLYEKVGNLSCSAVVMKNETNINFAGIITENNEILTKIDVGDYIVVPTANAYDMEHYTGKSTFVSILTNDYYQNYYCVKRFSYIDNMSKNMRSIYTTSYLDTIQDIKKPHSEIYSSIQKIYDDYSVNSVSKSGTLIWILISLIVVFAINFAITILYFVRKPEIIKEFALFLPAIVLLSLFNYSLFQSLAYKVIFDSWFIWTIHSQLITLLVGILELLLSIVSVFLLKNKKRTDEALKEFCEIQI